MSAVTPDHAFRSYQNAPAAPRSSLHHRTKVPNNIDLSSESLGGYVYVQRAVVVSAILLGLPNTAKTAALFPFDSNISATAGHFQKCDYCLNKRRPLAGKRDPIARQEKAQGSTPRLFRTSERSQNEVLVNLERDTFVSLGCERRQAPIADCGRSLYTFRVPRCAGHNSRIQPLRSRTCNLFENACPICCSQTFSRDNDRTRERFTKSCRISSNRQRYCCFPFAHLGNNRQELIDQRRPHGSKLLLGEKYHVPKFT
jgi:hypothetical protein